LLVTGVLNIKNLSVLNIKTLKRSSHDSSAHSRPSTPTLFLYSIIYG
jgi:hypothetical protein